MSLKLLQLIDYRNEQRAYCAHIKDKILSKILKKNAKQPWVAKIKNGKREFIRGYWDYSNARKAKSDKGVRVTFFLEEGEEYEVYEPLPRGGKRYFCKATKGGIKKYEKRIGN